MGCGICVRSSEQGRLREGVHVHTAACLTAATQLQRPFQPARYTDQLQIQCQTTWGTIKKALAENNKKIKCAFDNRIVYKVFSCCKLDKILNLLRPYSNLTRPLLRPYFNLTRPLLRPYSNFLRSYSNFLRPCPNLLGLILTHYGLFLTYVRSYSNLLRHYVNVSWPYSSLLRSYSKLL